MSSEKNNTINKIDEHVLEDALVNYISDKVGNNELNILEAIGVYMVFKRVISNGLIGDIDQLKKEVDTLINMVKSDDEESRRKLLKLTIPCFLNLFD